MINRQLLKIDATGQTVGRLATRIAIILRGKNQAEFLPYLDLGGIVQVINIDKLKFTGKKAEQKVYHRYSGYPGGLKTVKMSALIKNKPGEILKQAVKQMLPPVKFRPDMLKRLVIK